MLLRAVVAVAAAAAAAAANKPDLARLFNTTRCDTLGAAEGRKDVVYAWKTEPPYAIVRVPGSVIATAVDRSGYWGSAQALQSLMSAPEAVRHSQLFVDVGANVGTEAVPATLAGFRTIAVEPVPAHVEALRAAVALNCLPAGSMTVESVALGTKDEVEAAGGKVDIFVDAKIAGMSRIDGSAKETGKFKRPLGKNIPVELTTLDEVLERSSLRRDKKKVFMLKIDVEGHEANVLRGAERLFASERRPTYVLVECYRANAPGVWGSGNTENTVDFLVARGYKLYVISDWSSKPPQHETHLTQWEEITAIVQTPEATAEWAKSMRTLYHDVLAVRPEDDTAYVARLQDAKPYDKEVVPGGAR